MAEDKIVIDGVSYDMPDRFTIGEARILKKYTGLNLSELEGADTSDPNFMAAVVHITFARENPSSRFDELEERVNNVALENIESVDGEEADADPPTLAPLPVNGAHESSSGDDGSSGGEPSQEMLSHVSSGAQP